MIRLVLIGVLLLLWAVPVQAAEVLQVRSSSLLQVGDHNRTYTVALACSAVDASQEAEATAWLRQELPRRRKVNLRPVGSSDGQLHRPLFWGVHFTGVAGNVGRSVFLAAIILSHLNSGGIWHCCVHPAAKNLPSPAFILLTHSDRAALAVLPVSMTVTTH